MNIKQTAVALGLTLAASTAAQAGSIYLTGHDVLLHGGQANYDNTILNYLLDGRVATDYNIGLIRGNKGYVGSVGTNTLEGFGSISQADIGGFANGAAFSSYLSTVDVLVIPSHANCGGCDLSSADADLLETYSTEITAFFNAGGDIYANSGANDSTFYNFLPPTAVASGTPIGGSSGFTATTAGTGIGITNNMINGYPTHNRFFDVDPAFTVFETRGLEIISIGLLDGKINGTTGVISTGTPVPEPGVLALLSLGLVGIGAVRRKKSA